ncbi:MAG: DUF2970 domain-containing protein [Hylemonella sp.]|uniref:DUF2970 domain-containing protein n=1 Tax=Hylemonella sp. TaxID=2066020 RepID=UPI0022BC7AC2|nr:DUF2970 domain-containing protein [Hylemonella sp.]MCZ8252448.1 DUF2970 domain-containing protein [Hylemonella sp.]
MSKSTTVQQGSVWATVKAVAWSFLGVRKGSGFQEDISRLKPYHIIAVGLVGGILFVLFLIGLVNWIVAA